MKKILGLDLGTNSIGWAVVQMKQDENGNESFDSISCANSRIIPMDQATIGDFNKGNSKSQTSERTSFRGVRRLNERCHLRRERLNRVLSLMKWLPEHYAKHLDKYGKLLKGAEPKIPWRENGDGTFDFIFKDAFNEMLQEFREKHPDKFNNLLIPYDWTLYYLRKKALSAPVTNFELAWILHSFNQKRGYYQLRGEDNEENPSKLEEYYSLQVTDIEDTGEKKGKDTWYNIILENGFVYRRSLPEAPDWIGKVKDFIVTTDLDKDGQPKRGKDGNIKRSLRMPKEDDWSLLKKKTEHDIEVSRKTVGEFIYDSILANPDVKVRGSLVRTVERKFYKEELSKIIDAQMLFNDDLKSKQLYEKCIQALYPNNTAYRNSISKRDFKYLFINDILFYQRPLKSKKSLISDCPLEERHYTDAEGEIQVSHIKCAPRSNPYFQEFRLWQFIRNLRIYQREKYVNGTLKENVDVTQEFLTDNDAIANLFTWLNEKAAISQKELISYFDKKSKDKYRWNYVEDKIYPANETRGAFIKFLEKANVDKGFLTPEKEYALWHILYSVEDKPELDAALQTFAEKNSLPAGFVSVFSKFLPFKKDYASYSEKAIKRLLALMRTGVYWSETNIDQSTKQRIDSLVNGEYDEHIRERVRENTIALRKLSDFQGLPVWLASYVVYNRHSESKDVQKWRSPEDIDAYLASFKQHSMRNPIVESVVMETLRTVRDIWKREGHLDEIHVELGREMKNPADKRKRITEQVQRNENANLRVRALLTAFMNPEFEIENVRPNSPSQQEILKIYEDAVLETTDIPDDIQSILGKFSSAEKQPTTSEVLRYKAWLEQKYRSPYTGQIIPLGKLFTPDYEIEHIIPQALYFDDSFSNKVICESAVNTRKGNSLAYTFIKNHTGEIVKLTGGRTVQILSVEAYEKFVKETYSSSANRTKRSNLLAEELPEKFIQRQLNDSRYISKVVTTLLSNIVREDEEEMEVSKNVITCNGQITTRLKKDWGINDLWKDLMLPRFERLDNIAKSGENKEIYGESYVVVNANGRRVPTVPLHRSRGYDIKRIDHRHHVMDAIMIACANRNIVNYLNNSSACKDAKLKRYDLQHILCDKRGTDGAGNYKWVLKMPSRDFVSQVRTALEKSIISFKQNLRIINKSSNKYEKIIDGKKMMVRQTKGDNWAIRKSMHKDTVWSEINLRLTKPVSVNEALEHKERLVDKKIKQLLAGIDDTKKMKEALSKEYPDLKRLEVYYYTAETKERYFATRMSLSTEFSKEFIEGKVTDTGIRSILLKHLEANENKPDKAFSPEGIERMNANIVALNGGHSHKPIYKVRKYEKADKFAIGEVGNKSKKFVEADKGTNLFFAIYISKEGKRSFRSVPLVEAIANEKAGLSPVPDRNGEDTLLFYLSPNDLVYVPTPDEIERGFVDDIIDKNRIYKMVSSTNVRCYFIPTSVACPLVDQIEFNSLNKIEKSLSGEIIKKICLPIKVNRLGEIIALNKKLR